MEQIKFSDLFDEGSINSGLKGLITQVEGVKNSLVEMLNEVKEASASISSSLSSTSSVSKGGRDDTRVQAGNVEQLYSAYQELIKAINACNTNLANLNETRKKTPKQPKETISLAQAYSSLSELIQQTGVSVEQLLQSQRQLNIAQKNGGVAAKSATGSYNQLYAQYNLIKNVLNAMSTEMRNAEGVGKLWEAEALRLMNAMKGMQEATGKHTLSVGDYTKAFNGLNLSTQQVVRELPTLANGINTFFIAISNNVPMLIDDIQRYRSAQKSAAEEGKQLASLSSALTKAVFANPITYITIALTLLSKYGQQLFALAFNFKSATERAKEFLEIQKQLAEFRDMRREVADATYEIAIATEEANKRVAESTNQPLENRFTIENNILALKKQQIEKDKELLKEDLETYEGNKKAYDEQLKKVNRLSIAQIQSGKATTKRAKKELENEETLLKLYKDRIKTVEDLKQAEENLRTEEVETGARQYNEIVQREQQERQVLYETRDTEVSLIEERFKKRKETLKAEYDKETQAINSILFESREYLTSKEIDSYQKRLKLLQKQNKQNLDKVLVDEKAANEKAQADIERYKLTLMNEGYEKDYALLKQSYDEKARLLKNKIENDKTLTKEERDALSEQFSLLPKEFSLAINSLKLSYESKDLSKALEHKNALLENSNKSSYEKEKENIENEIKYWQDYLNIVKTYGNLSAKELGIVTNEVNDKISGLTRKSMAADLKYQNIAIEQALDHKLSIIETSNKTEFRKERESINAEIDYWTEYIKSIKSYGNLSESELEIAVQRIKDKIAGLEHDKKNTTPTDFWDWIGLNFGNEEFEDALKNAFSMASDYMDEFMDKRMEMAEIAVEAAQKESEAAKTNLDYEMEARANGYANNVDLARKEYEEKLAIEQKAIAEKQRLQKIQEGIDTATQISSLVTATAELWAAYAGLPWVGQALTIAATALMWGSFIAAKVQAAQLANAKTYGEGGMEYINYGGSHASGNDVDFGHTKEGRARRVEKGEVVSVINKKNTEKYGVSRIENIINSLNNGTFEKQYISSSIASSLSKSSSVVESTERNTLGDMYSLAFSMLGMPTGDSADLSSIERGISTLVSQNDVRIVPTPYGRIEYRGNNTRIIRNS